MTDIDIPPEAVEAAIIAHHNFVLGEDVPLTKRDIGIVFQAWHVTLAAALPHIAAAVLREAAETFRAEDKGGDWWYADWLEHRAAQVARGVTCDRP